MGAFVFCARTYVKNPMALLLVVIFLRILTFWWKLDSGEKRLILRMLRFSDRHIETLEIGQCIAPETSLRYHLGNVTATKAFDPKWLRHLCYFGLLNNSSADSSSAIVRTDPVFVTAFSDNHFRDGMAMLSQFSDPLRRYPAGSNVKLYLYDLGIRRSRARQIRSKFGRFVTIRRFPFELFPPYVLNLKEYRWKVLVIADVLRTQPSVWWMDSSIRITNFTELQSYYSDLRKCPTPATSKNCTQYPFTFAWPSGHGLYAATNPLIYDYFPIDLDRAKRLAMAAIGFTLIFATQEVKRNVLKWWVLCALEKDCMAPPGHRLKCAWDESRFVNYMNCHRYEQSAANLLVAMANDYKYERYTRISKRGFKVDRLQ